ncbi:MAG TPA: S9 family peptidase [Oligoflexus sp.]|uniref:S9 family peptidase n=1 Tax=Oligoflexus sp. TaxID=1971216 RepID=UPI002D3D1F28|nr:S9 family peptidase [Oligoflexus sp.]HYX31640.1 S9 family peptidase [Oligoflexus sp.]
MLLRLSLLLTSIGFTSSLGLAMAPPKTVRLEKKLEKHGDVRVDPYLWLHDRQNPKVIQHLKDENAYTEFVLKDTEKLQTKLYEEIKGRIEKNDQSAPYSHHGYAYYTRTEGEGEYPIYCRRKGAMEGPEEILVNGNVRARGNKYFAMTAPSLSPDERYMAYAVDTQGRRFYTIEVYDRKTGKRVLSLEKTKGNFEWAEDSKTLVYARQDPTTLRSYQILRRTLGDLKSELIHEEKDNTFELSISKSLSERLLFINATSTTTSEVRFLPTDKVKSTPTLVQQRVRGLEYSVEDGGDRLIILTNSNAQNFQVMETTRDKPGMAHWKTLVAHSPQILIEGLEVFDSHIVLNQREGGLSRLRILSRKDGSVRDIPFQEAAYVVSPYINAEYDTKDYLYAYQSLTRPNTVYAWDFAAQQSREIKQTKVNNYDPNAYATERVMVKARDGVDVPVSLVYKKGLQKNGKNPALIYGYGSYGFSMEPSFRSARASLLDRGFVFAIAHIRGGSEMGRAWYESGKLLNKKNTFHDFIDCSQWLIDQGFTSPDHLYAMGGSAGGLLMGTIINLRPDLYKGVIAQVPFVDVVSSMLDETIPLTTGEYDEWGDPRKKEFYDYMKSYSPYDNVKDQKYPHMLVTTGLHDSQVQYWEPAKWVAKLRDHNKAPTSILLRTNLTAGHGGASGRFAVIKEVAQEYAFMLKLEGLTL